jgi:hypothetical protein
MAKYSVITVDSPDESPLAADLSTLSAELLDAPFDELPAIGELPAVGEDAELNELLAADGHLELEKMLAEEEEFEQPAENGVRRRFSEHFAQRLQNFNDLH